MCVLQVENTMSAAFEEYESLPETVILNFVRGVPPLNYIMICVPRKIYKKVLSEKGVQLVMQTIFC